MRLNWGTAPVNAFQILLACLTLLALALAFVRPQSGAGFFARVEKQLRRIAGEPWLCAVILFVFPLAIRLFLLPVYGAPAPFISDEYAYLLQSDTFSSGRLTNPSPPLPGRFTSVYILTEPTYTAEYQPAQGLMLAAGQRLTGVPWAGVMLSMGLLCGFIYWALLAWVPSVWSFVGTLVVVDVSLGVLSYWMNSYWGGCVPAIGGALTLGGLARIPGSARPGRNALLTGAGLLVLFNSRPLEGVFLTAVVAGALLCWTFRSRQLSFELLRKRVVPALAACAVIVVSFAGYYNARVTGRASLFPYLLYRTEYGLPQGFFWQKPVLANMSTMPADIRSEYEDQLRQHERRRSLKALIAATGGKLRRFWEFYIGVPLTLAAMFAPFIWRAPGRQLVFWTLLVVLGLDNLLFFAYFPHYSAAVTVLIALVLVFCLQRMRASSRAGLFLSRALPVICLLGLLIPAAGRWLQSSLPLGVSNLSKLWQSEFAHDVERESFTPALERQAGQHLVLVKYTPYDGHRKFEWIYNRADLAAAKIIWARYSDDAASNQQLIEHFPERTLWLAEPDAVPPRVTPLSPHMEHSSSQ